jgi:hypothetical protein
LDIWDIALNRITTRAAQQFLRIIIYSLDMNKPGNRSEKVLHTNEQRQIPALCT